jgi:pyruvate kinase
MIKKKTKIVATISDRKCDEAFIRELYENGMNVARLNTAHQSFEDTLRVVKSVRAVSDKIALLLDTKGPEIRTTACEEPVGVKKGQILKISGNPDCKTSAECICVSHKYISRDVPLGSKVMIDDGDIELIAVSVDKDILYCEVLNDGLIKGKKSVNVPNVHIDLPSLSRKDIEYIDFAIENDLDFIAHSFVRNKEDVIAIQNILSKKGSSIKVIAKIENQSGVENIDEILDHAYGVMVARGDLAIEIPYEKIPGIQKMLIKKCIDRRKPVIIATQMLHSMINNPRPTRAEVNDIASAIYSQADAVMLSGETAYGSYPVESVRTMATVAREVERSKEQMYDIPIVVINNEVSAFLIKSAVTAAVNLNAKAIVADSMSGRTIRAMSAYRGNKIIYALCYDRRVVRKLALSYGVHAQFMEPRETSHEFIQVALNMLMATNCLKEKHLIVIAAGNFGRAAGVTYIEIGTVKDMLDMGLRNV